MIQIVLLDGPYAGRVRTPADLPGDLTPETLLTDCAINGWRWRLIWPPAPAVAQSWAEDWLAAALEDLRQTHGVDLAGRVSATAQPPPVAELQAWVRADLVGRVFLAAIQGRAVRFQGRRWNLPHPHSGEAFTVQIGDLEDALAGSGQWLGVLADGDDGTGGDLVIGMAGPESAEPE